jgi:hypothetical protein
MRQNVRIRKRKVRVVPDAEQGAWIMYQMRRHGLRLNTIAQASGVTVQMVHGIVWGRKTSGKVQKQIANSLGYLSWLDLLASKKEVAA